MNEQQSFYEQKLNYEMDSWDLFEALKNGEDVVAIDARSKDAFEQEHIPNAISFPHRTMSDETTANLNRASTYVVYCSGIGCNASTHGALKLTKPGFKVKELIGGLEWWKKDGYQTEGVHHTSGQIIVCGC
jgi:rhodanese-related sulfurtransferase